MARSTPPRTVDPTVVALGLLASSCTGGSGAAASRREAAALPLARPGGRTDETPDVHRVQAGWRLKVTVYYLRSFGAMRYLLPEEHEVQWAPSVDKLADAAVTELLAGRPRYPGATRPFPTGTRLLGLRLAGGTATVNLSRRALGADAGDGYPVQALVWTVTHLPQVKRVVVQVEGRTGGVLDGRPLAGLLGMGAGGHELVRDRAARLAPILLEDPSPRAAVAGNRVVAKGHACVVAGTVGLRLHDRTGRVVSQGYATLASSAPEWGRFSGALVFAPPARRQLWTLEAFETSALDASVTYSVSVAVWVGR